MVARKLFNHSWPISYFAFVSCILCTKCLLAIALYVKRLIKAQTYLSVLTVGRTDARELLYIDVARRVVVSVANGQVYIFSFALLSTDNHIHNRSPQNDQTKSASIHDEVGWLVIERMSVYDIALHNKCNRSKPCVKCHNLKIR